MPVHDWTRVSAGTFHDFHNRLIAHLTEALNTGLLPEDYYAQSEQRTNDIVADILTLRQPRSSFDRPTSDGGGLAVADAPPHVSTTMVPAESHTAGLKQRRVVVRHVTRHDVVAVVEIISPANKDRPSTVSAFVQKAVDAIQAGVHLLVVDLFPPGRHDPGGLHRAIWDHFGDEYIPPPDKPLIAVSYQVGLPTAYLEPLALGEPLPTMPLFFSPERYVNLPLEPAYDAAWNGTPAYWRAVVEGREPAPEAD
ncbi:MAG: DUF4058 family protein [Planctomycetaceae bacterium]